MLKIAVLLGLLSAVTSQVYRGQPLDDHAMNFLVKVYARFPHQQQGFTKQQAGGGFIVSQTMILTAAHNVVVLKNLKLPLIEVEVVAGTKNLAETPLSGMQTHAVLAERVHVYPRFINFATGNYDNRYDVALIVLLRPLRLGPMVRVANMGQPPMGLGHSCQVMGWGVTSKIAPDQNGVLREFVFDSSLKAMIGTVKKLHQSQCDNFFGHMFYRTHHMCYGCMQGDMCQAPGKGDSGGPLVCSHQGRFYVVAVHTMGCNNHAQTCRPESPSAGVAINRAILQWINFVSEFQMEEDRQKQPRYNLHTTTGGGDGSLEGNYVNEICTQTY